MKFSHVRIALVSACIAVALIGLTVSAALEEKQQFTIYPVGWVRKADGKTFIEIEKQYEDGLLGLDGFSHVHVIWWFHKNDTPEKRRVLRVHPMANPENPLTGVFATRSPVRPNLTALTVCKILSVEGCRVFLESIDAFDGTPVIDLKPYVLGDRIANVRVPQWAKADAASNQSQ